MKQLRELSNIVTSKKLMKLSIIGQSSDSKLDDLYQIAKDPSINDDDAAQILYQKPGNFSPFQKLKSKLKDRLVDMLFLIDVNQLINGSASLAYKEAWRLWSSANLLFLHNAILQGHEYAEKALKLAIKFEHVDLVTQISKVLRMHSATRLGDFKKFEHYNELYKKYQEISMIEAKVEEYYESVMIHSVQQKSNGELIASLGKEYFLELEPLLEKYDQFSIHRFIRYIQVTYLLSTGKYEETIEASQKALDFFKTKDFNLQNTIIGFLIHQLICYTQLKEYHEGRLKLEECLAIVGNEYTLTYFRIKEMGLILFLHSSRYQEAYHLAKEILGHSKFKNQDQLTQETWKFYGAYIHYLIHIEKITPDKEDTVFTRFRLGKFLNEVPVFSKDKRGMNIPILIIQSLFTIALGKYDQAFDRIEAIERFTSRYIRKDDHYRSNCFIKMLLLIPKFGFHKMAVLRHSEKLHEKLLEVPLEIANQPHEIEIIPYEDLWGMALESLQKKHVKIKRA